MQRPLLWIALFLCAGAGLGGDLGTGTAAGLLGLAGVALLLAAVSAPAWGRWALGAAALAAGAAGAATERAAHEAAPLALWLAERPDDGPPVRVRGVAAADARQRGGAWLLLLDVVEIGEGQRSHALSGRLRVAVAGSAQRPEVVAGDEVRLWASLRRHASFRNPGAAEADGPGRDGSHGLGYCKSPWLVERLPRRDSRSLAVLAARLRARARAAILRYVPPGPEQGLVRAMTLGDREGLDPETSEAFQAAGTYHVLALSGAQVALVAGLALAAFRLLRTAPALSGGATAVALCFYALLVGGETPVLRATVMAVVLLLGKALDLDADASNLLGGAACALTVARPSSVFEPGFQLSFVATWGLIALSRPLLARLPRLPLRLERVAALSLAAQLPLTPLLAWHFHRLAPAALLLNPLAIPLSGAVLGCGALIVTCAGLAPALAPLAGDLGWVAAHALLRSADLVRAVPALDWRVPAPGPWAVAALLAGLALLGRRAALSGLLVAAGVLGTALGPDAPAGDGRLHLTVLDVGQGDALVVRSPRGRVWIVDAGPAYDGGFDLGAAVVGPYLWRTGVRRIDRLTLTHAHPDHVGGAPFLARAFAPRQIWEGPAPRQDRSYARLAAELGRSGSARLAVASGVGVDWDGVAVQVIGPRGGTPHPRVRNDDSVVLALRFRDSSLLLPGDAEAEGERGLPAFRAAVLKVPHHGSRTSSTPEFVASSAPLVAVISVGRRNRFGHPDPGVLERYARRGSLLLRTDRDGAVTVSTDGSRIWVSSQTCRDARRVR